MSKELSLKDLVESLPVLTENLQELDLSAFWGKEAGAVVFTYAEPSTAEIFKLDSLAKLIAFQKEEWSAEQCQTVALLCASHRTPKGDAKSIYLSYVTLFDRLNAEQAMTLLSEFVGKFPALANFAKAVTTTKNA